MTRPRKATVDYFPHACSHGKTMYILEQRYGNDGYAAWFKILELLGSSEGHFIDCRNPIALEFLQAKIRLPADICEEIINLLARVEAIDAELWSCRVIWSQKFVEGIRDVYVNRRVDIPIKPVIYNQESASDGVSSCSYPQSKVKESKVKESILPPQKKTASSKKIKVSLPDNFSISEEVKTWANKHGHTDLDRHLEAFIDLCKSNGYTAVDWDSKFKRAIREDWGKVRNGNGTREGPGPTASDRERARQWAIRKDAEREAAKRENS